MMEIFIKVAFRISNDENPNKKYNSVNRTYSGFIFIQRQVKCLPPPYKH